MAGQPPRSSSHPLPVLLQPDGQLDAAKAMFASSLHPESRDVYVHEMNTRTARENLGALPALLV
uniref:Uncharacterized protein n=1 Tax=Oryza glumipatula TaxID=40148 RepID=A0A0D9ZGS5_9ORYZ